MKNESIKSFPTHLHNHVVFIEEHFLTKVTEFKIDYAYMQQCVTFTYLALFILKF